MKYKLALIWKEDFGPPGQQSSSSSLSQVRRLWDNCSQIPRHVCVVVLLMPWPSLSPFLVKFTQILESISLDNPHKAAVLSVVVHLFLPLIFLLTCLDTALCEAASLVMNVCVFSSLWRVSMIVFWTTVRSAVFPMIVSPSEPNWDHFEGSGNLCRCFELISWLACYHILNCWEWICGFLLNVSQNHQRTKDLNCFSLCALNLFNTRVSQFELASDCQKLQYL